MTDQGAALASPSRQNVLVSSVPIQQSLSERSGRSVLSVETEDDLLGVREFNQPSILSATDSRRSDSSASPEDDDTVPSSTGPQNDPSHRSDRSSSIGRFIQNTRRRLSSGPNSQADQEGEAPLYNVEGDIPEEDDDIYQGQVRPLIYGYLHKKGRNGKWQKRFFETDGESLSYFKSKKRVKLLATLDLFRVGAIVQSKEDPSGCTFLIQVADRPYSLRADSRSTCKDWVITLNRIKEARMEVGGVKLVTPKFQPPPDLLDAVQSPTNALAPRVVLVANRQRTRAIDSDNTQTWEQLVSTGSGQETVNVDPAKEWVTSVGSRQKPVLGKWQKRQRTFYSLSRRLMRWARSIRTMASCTDVNHQVLLDNHLHPPGHDDMPVKKREESPRKNDSVPENDNISWTESKEEEPETDPPMIVKPMLDDEGQTRQLS